MATLKYKDVSPYKQHSKEPFEDFLYKKYLQDISSVHPNLCEAFGFALFGIGRAGSIHLTSLVRNPRVTLLYIVEDDTTKWDRLKKYWNLTSTKFLTSKDSEIVFKDAKVKAVLVASPTYTHENIVIKALDNNKAVFCEKPIAEDIETTKKCFEKAKKVKQPLLSAFNRRFDPAYSSVRNRVRSGEVGHVMTVKVCSRDSPLPTIDYLKVSGGIFHDCAVHDIDMIIYVLGEYPTKVSTMAHANIPEIAAINDYDTVAILLYFPSGSVGIIDLSRNCNYGYDQRLEVFGYRGMIKSENEQPMHSVETYSGSAIKKSPIFYSFPSRFFQGYVNELEHFLDVLQGKSDLNIDSKDTLAVSKIASACEESAKTGKVVELKWTAEELPHSHKLNVA